MQKRTTHNIHKPLEEIRQERGMTLRQLHAVAVQRMPELTNSRLSRIALGYAHPPWDEVCALAEALGVTPERLAGSAPLVRPPPVQAAPAAPEPVTPAPVAPTPPAAAATAATPVALPAMPAMVIPRPPVTDDTAAFPVPPAQLPERNGRPIDQFRSALGAELRKATDALQIPKLPAKHWAAWRSYEQVIRRTFAQLAQGS